MHLVDEGVDTGGVLYQARIAPTLADNFPTYFYLQAAAARPLAVKAVEDALAGRIAHGAVGRTVGAVLSPDAMVLSVDRV